MLTQYQTTGLASGGQFKFGNVFDGDAAVDGLGRLISASETITTAAGGSNSYNWDYYYDMRSQLTGVDKDGAAEWRKYQYNLDGNIDYRKADTAETDYTYDGDLMDAASSSTGGDNFTLGWDENGNMTLTDQTSGDDTTLEYNFDNKLRHAQKGADTIDLKYDPMGNRIWKSGAAGTRKYVVDIAGKLPTILMGSFSV